jgi:hypothetical protein
VFDLALTEFVIDSAGSQGTGEHFSVRIQAQYWNIIVSDQGAGK